MELSESDVVDMVMVYVKVVGEVKWFGFDVIEIYGVYGYLIDEFFWNVMNICEDKYGGDLVDCVMFVGDIICECCKVVGVDMLIILCFL